MIAADTNVIISLIEHHDPHHRETIKLLDRLGSQRLTLCEPVLAESLHFLSAPHLRARLVRFISTDRVEWLSRERSPSPGDVLSWMLKYAEHEPDYVDGFLVLLSTHRPVRIWTYDSEFATVWRRPDGSRVPLVR